MIERDGFFYPKSEERLFRGGCGIHDIEPHVLPHVKSRRNVVQAGGAVGVWPITLAQHFERIYTFEPNTALLECLRANMEKHGTTNIEVRECALWDRPGKGRLTEYDPVNMGAWYMKPDPHGDITLSTIDSLNLDNVDLIQLDIEGAEVEALRGASATIAKCRPVIVVECKQTQQFYGRTGHDLERELRSMKYVQAHKYSRDQVWKPIHD